MENNKKYLCLDCECSKLKHGVLICNFKKESIKASDKICLAFVEKNSSEDSND